MKWPVLSFIAAGMLSFGLGISYGWKTNLPPNGGWSNEVLKPGLPPTKTQEAFGMLLAKTPEEIQQVDTATLNWACLGGFPGAQDIDLDAARARITKLAEKVKTTTQATLEQARKKNKPVQDSPQFRAAILFYVLQQDYKIAHFADQYDPDHSGQVDWGKERPEDLFFQSGSTGKGDPAVGNPILIVAVGQELQYPIKLASAPGHFYAAWDDGKTKFIIQDCTGNATPLTEDQFRKFFSATDVEIKEGSFYHEYTQPEVLAVFLQARGNVLEHMGMPHHATLAYAAAHRFAPDTPLYSENLVSTIDSAMESHNLDRKGVDMGSPERFMQPRSTPNKDLTP
jgi:hypothetical protein